LIRILLRFISEAFDYGTVYLTFVNFLDPDWNASFAQPKAGALQTLSHQCKQSIPSGQGKWRNAGLA
jgi:hypothetical protein